MEQTCIQVKINCVATASSHLIKYLEKGHFSLIASISFAKSYSSSVQRYSYSIGSQTRVRVRVPPAAEYEYENAVNSCILSFEAPAISEECQKKLTNAKHARWVDQPLSIATSEQSG